jgi:hypothetical protein
MWTPEEQRMLDFLWKYAKSTGRKYLRWEFNFDDNPWDGLNVSEDDFGVDMNYGSVDLNIPTKIRDFLFKFYEEKIEPEVELSFNKILDTVGLNEASNYQLSIIMNLKERKISAIAELNYWTESEEQVFILEMPDEIYESLVRVVGESEVRFLKTAFEGSGDSGYVTDTLIGLSETFDMPQIVETFIDRNLPGGWEINEGSQGSVEFDLEEKSVNIFYIENIDGWASDTILELEF